MFTSIRVLFFLSALAVVILGQQQPNGAPPAPPFLEGAPPATVAEFQKLIEGSHTKTDAQVDQEVEAWIAKQSADIKSKFTTFKAQMKEHESKAAAAHDAAIVAFSPAARDADKKLSEIANNPALTAQQKSEQIDKFVSSLSPEVRSEIEKAMQG